MAWLLAFWLRSSALPDLISLTSEMSSIRGQSLNGFFNLVDFTTDKIVSITDKVVEGVSGLIGGVFRKRNKKEEE